ncbi:toprim domain-containing protein [Flavobacterium sp. I3-2]|uniref:toprim domain-containing protein n=1 Tax=Flavobacterium sp. I3-2 TaxID=2748319 RepID=UPI0015AD57B4|nr:toprim domain-containing protein [Flavobacterium sp. I3-2]
MNCETAKNIQLTSILDKIGACKIRTSNHDIWYLSPFRKEKTASFKVDIRKNIFYDFGEGFGGNTIDFVMRYFQCDISNALNILRNDFSSFSFQQQTVPVLTEQTNLKKSYEITSVQCLSNPILLNYLKSRKLHLEICKKYLFEVNYEINNKKYFGVGFKNDSNGFEIRNKYVKICLGKKWFTHLNNDSKSVVILESWSDFMALLTLHPKMEKVHDYLILNSLALHSKIDPVTEKYIQIFLALDSDEAGSKATQKLLDKWKGKSSDFRNLYPNAKDINEFLIKKTPIGIKRKL